MWYIWLIAAGVFFVFEIATTGFLIFWLGIAALVAMIISLFTNSLIVQTVVFVIASAILIPLTKPIVDKYVDKGSIKTNTSLLINRHGKVTIEINPIEATGQVKVNNEIWSATCAENIIIPVGTEVEVLEISGVKLLVSPLR